MCRCCVWCGGLGLVAIAFFLGRVTAPMGTDEVSAQPSDSLPEANNLPSIKGWQKGKGWGWIWGKDDEVGSLNAMTPESVHSALSLVKEGKVYDLGVPFDRESMRWPGHNPTEVMTFRSPEGEKRQKDFAPVANRESNPAAMGWHSCALFISDNVGTQIDGLGHVTVGEDNHWYNGFKEADWGGNFGIRKCDVTTIPPIITRGVLIDVAGSRGVKVLPAHYRISADDLQAALEKQNTEIHPGDSVFIRTGTLSLWGKNGANHEELRPHDAAGIDLDAAKWLVEQKGAILIGSDTSGLEWTPGPNQSGTFIPVHKYLLVEQGVHIAEFHNLEQLAQEKIYDFCYICTTNNLRGTTAGFALRPLALR